MSTTPNLALPYLMPAQAQKHVTHNEALRGLDATMQIGVVDRDLASPPASPVDGDRYIVASPASGTWSGKELRIAAWQDGAWMYYTPRPGWLAWISDESLLVAWNGTDWVAASGGGGGGASDHGALTGLGDDDHPQYHNDARGDARYLQSVNPVALVGVNATADATNRLAVASAASLFNHAGAGHQQKINKAAAGDTASVLYQTAFSGRAEMGLTGDDDFHFKVSADGATWNEAILIDKDTGEVSFPNTALGGGGGEANTASNVGPFTSLSVFKQKVGVDLEFRKLTPGNAITLAVVSDGIAITNSRPVPDGGTTGQVLSKFSDVNNHVGWRNETPPTPLVAGRMPPLAALDVKLGPTAIGSVLANLSTVADRLYMARFIAPEDFTAAEIGARVGTGTAGNMRLGLYAVHTNGLPGALLVDSGDLTTASAAHVSAVISEAMTAGSVYWLAAVFSAAPSMWGAAGGGAGNAPLGYNLAAAGPASANVWALYRSYAFGALPADESASSWTVGAVNAPAVFLDI